MLKTCVGVVAALFLATPNFGQKQPDSSKITTLEDVIVTANKMAQKQNTTGKVVSVITKKQIEQNSGRTLAQLLSEQAGITINGANNNAGTNQTVFMRGANSGRTLILIDGIPVYDPSLISNEFDLNLVALQNVERIEIARGAQSTMYGSDAIAGVINIITQTNATDPVQFKASGSLGSFATTRGNLQAIAKTDKYRFDVRYSRLKSDGFSTAQDREATGTFDKDGIESDNISSSFHYKLSSKLTSKTFFQFNRYNTEIDNGAFSDEKDFTSGSKNKMGGQTLTWQSDRWKLVANYLYSQTERNLLNDSTDAPGFTKYSTNDFEGKAHFGELYGSFDLGKGFTLLSGVDFRQSQMNSKLLSISSFGPFTDTFRDTTLYQYSGYGSLIFNQGNLNIETGLRFNNHEKYGGNTTFTFNPSYAINNQIRIFGSIASGFKAPSIYQLYSGFGDENLDPETSVNYELGLQYNQKKANYRAVFFYRDIEDGLDFDNVNFVYFNFGRQLVRGLEIETSYQPLKGLSLSGNYTFLAPDETVQSRLTAKDTSYSYLLRRPKHQLNLQAIYQINEKCMISLSGKYLSDRYDVGGFRVADTKLESYFLVNAYLEYKVTPRVKWFGDAQNLLNKTFFDLRGFNSTPRNLQTGIQMTL